MPKRNYLTEAADILRKRREAAEAESEIKRAELYAALPEVQGLDAALSQTAVKVLSAMMAGGDTKEKLQAVRNENEALQKKRARLLQENGYPKDHTDVKYACCECADSGYKGINMCSCMRLLISEMRLEDSDLGRLSKTQSFDTFDISYYDEGRERENIQKVLRRLRSFAEGFSSESTESWLLLGDTGLGKTHLSTAVGVEVIRRGYDVVYRTVQSLIDDYEEVQFRGGSSELTREYHECDLLIIDDLGAEMSTQFTVSCIYNIINARMNKQKPTIISTNLTQKELRERYADRITSRLFGEYIPLLFEGVDIRRKRLGGKRR